jgi:hypothetical protein
VTYGTGKPLVQVLHDKNNARDCFCTRHRNIQAQKTIQVHDLWPHKLAAGKKTFS